MNKIIITLTLTLLLFSGCVYTSVEDQRIEQENKYNSLLTDFNALKVMYATLNDKYKAYKPIECSVCEKCSNVSENCLIYIQRIKRLDKERDGIISLNNSIYCDQLKFNLSKCEIALNITEEE